MFQSLRVRKRTLKWARVKISTFYLIFPDPLTLIMYLIRCLTSLEFGKTSVKKFNKETMQNLLAFLSWDCCFYEREIWELFKEKSADELFMLSFLANTRGVLSHDFNPEPKVSVRSSFFNSTLPLLWESWLIFSPYKGETIDGNWEE